MLKTLTIEITDIMLMINYAWKLSFARVSTKKLAIAERGWLPLNRNLLNDTPLHSTMTNDQKANKLQSGIVIPYHYTTNYVEIDDSAPTLDTKFITLSPPTIAYKPNLQNGMAAWCVNAIVQN